MGRKNANYFGCQTFVNDDTDSRSYRIAVPVMAQIREKNSCTSSELVSFVIMKN